MIAQNGSAPSGIAQQRISRLEYALAGITLFMFAEAFLPRLLAPGPVDASGEAPESTLLRFLWLPFYGLIGVGLVLAARDAFRTMSRSPWLVTLALLAIASAWWSIDAELSFRRGIAVFATTLLGVYLASRFDWIGALRLFACVWFCLMAASFVAGIVAPGFSHAGEIHPGAWIGGWGEKNALGGHAARASFLFAFLVWRDAGPRKWWLGGLVLSLALVVLSKSATALLGAGLGLGVLAAAWWMLKGRRWSLALAWGGASVGGFLVLIYLTAPALLLGVLGKDETLTGRTDIWSSSCARSNRSLRSAMAILLSGGSIQSRATGCSAPSTGMRPRATMDGWILRSHWALSALRYFWSTCSLACGAPVAGRSHRQPASSR